MTPLILTSALDGDEWSGLYTSRFIPGENSACNVWKKRKLGGPQSQCGNFGGEKPFSSDFFDKQGKFLALLFYFLPAVLWSWSRLSL